jgi:hypothetical protein
VPDTGPQLFLPSGRFFLARLAQANRFEPHRPQIDPNEAILERLAEIPK